MGVIIKDSESFKITAEDNLKLINHIESSLRKQIKCPNCHRSFFIHIVVSEDDKRIWDRFVEGIKSFFDRHPEISQKTHDDFNDFLLDMLQKLKRHL